MRLSGNGLKWIGVLLVLAPLSKATSSIKDQSNVSLPGQNIKSANEKNVAKRYSIQSSNGLHKKTDRQDLLREFVLDDVSPFIEDSNEDGVKRSKYEKVNKNLRARESLHQRRLERIWDQSNSNAEKDENPAKSAVTGRDMSHDDFKKLEYPLLRKATHQEKAPERKQTVGVEDQKSINLTLPNAARFSSSQTDYSGVKKSLEPDELNNTKETKIQGMFSQPGKTYINKPTSKKIAPDRNSFLTRSNTEISEKLRGNQGNLEKISVNLENEYGIIYPFGYKTDYFEVYPESAIETTDYKVNKYAMTSGFASERTQSKQLSVIKQNTVNEPKTTKSKHDYISAKRVKSNRNYSDSLNSSPQDLSNTKTNIFHEKTTKFKQKVLPHKVYVNVRSSTLKSLNHPNHNINTKTEFKGLQYTSGNKKNGDMGKPNGKADDKLGSTKHREHDSLEEVKQVHKIKQRIDETVTDHKNDDNGDDDIDDDFYNYKNDESYYNTEDDFYKDYNNTFGDQPNKGPAKDEHQQEGNTDSKEEYIGNKKKLEVGKNNKKYFIDSSNHPKNTKLDLKIQAAVNKNLSGSARYGDMRSLSKDHIERNEHFEDNKRSIRKINPLRKGIATDSISSNKGKTTKGWKKKGDAGLVDARYNDDLTKNRNLVQVLQPHKDQKNKHVTTTSSKNKSNNESLTDEKSHEVSTNENDFERSKHYLYILKSNTVNSLMSKKKSLPSKKLLKHMLQDKLAYQALSTNVLLDDGNQKAQIIDGHQESNVVHNTTMMKRTEKINENTFSPNLIGKSKSNDQKWKKDFGNDKKSLPHKNEKNAPGKLLDNLTVSSEKQKFMEKESRKVFKHNKSEYHLKYKNNLLNGNSLKIEPALSKKKSRYMDKKENRMKNVKQLEEKVAKAKSQQDTVNSILKGELPELDSSDQIVENLIDNNHVKRISLYGRITPVIKRNNSRQNKKNKTGRDKKNRNQFAKNLRITNQHVLQDKIIIEQSIPNSGFDLYIVRVSPKHRPPKLLTPQLKIRRLFGNRNIMKKALAHLPKIRSKSKHYKAKNSSFNQRSSLKMILDTPVQSIVDFIRPYIFGKAKLGNMKLKDFIKNLSLPRKATHQNNFRIRSDTSTLRNIGNRKNPRKMNSKQLKVARTLKLVEWNRTLANQTNAKTHSASRISGATSSIVQSQMSKYNRSNGLIPAKIHKHQLNLGSEVASNENSTQKVANVLKIIENKSFNKQVNLFDYHEKNIKIILPNNLKREQNHRIKYLNSSETDQKVRSLKQDRTSSKAAKVDHVQHKHISVSARKENIHNNISGKLPKRLRLKEKSEADAVSRSVLSHKSENYFRKGITEENIKIFLSESMLQDGEIFGGKYVKKSFTPKNRGSFEVSHRNELPSEKETSNRTEYLKSVNGKMEEGVNNVNYHRSHSKSIFSNSPKDSTLSSPKFIIQHNIKDISVRSAIQNAQSFNEAWESPSSKPKLGQMYGSTGDLIYQQGHTPTENSQNYMGSHYSVTSTVDPANIIKPQSNIPASYDMEKNNEGLGPQFNQFAALQEKSKSVLPYTFRIYGITGTLKQSTRRKMLNTNKYADKNGNPYSGIFGNADEDMEHSCINTGKQDFVDFCPAGWTSYKQFCFFTVDGNNRWSDIPNLCSRWSAKMAMPKSQDVLAFLVDKLASEKQFYTSYFVGLRKKDEKWEWIDDTPLSQSLKDSSDNEPHSCAVIHEGSLRKMPCDMEGGYICELKKAVSQFAEGENGVPEESPHDTRELKQLYLQEIHRHNRVCPRWSYIREPLPSILAQPLVRNSTLIACDPPATTASHVIFIKGDLGTVTTFTQL